VQTIFLDPGDFPANLVTNRATLSPIPLYCMLIYVRKNNEQTGPFDENHVLAGIRDGVYSLSDLAWREGMAGWEPLENLYPSSSTPPPLPPPLAAHKEQQLGDSAGIRLLLPVGRSGWAIAAGYLGLFSVLMIPAPICLVVSILAIMDIRKSKSSEHPRHGMGRAIFGLIMSVPCTILFGCVLIAYLLRK